MIEEAAPASNVVVEVMTSPVALTAEPKEAAWTWLGSRPAHDHSEKRNSLQTCRKI
jgi:hypothetical protein